MFPLRNYQKQALKAICDNERGIVNMWCGTGKTRVICAAILKLNEELNVVICPSLGLICQFRNDYILNRTDFPHFNDYKIHSFCSAKEKNKGRSDHNTGKNHLEKFLRSSGKKIVTVTYQSMEKFSQVIVEQQINIGAVFYDEAHHSTADTYKKLIYEDNKINELVKRSVFFTATLVNRNKIDMEKECGGVIYTYLYCDAVNDGYCREYEIMVNVSEKKTSPICRFDHIFEAMSRAILTCDYEYANILVFHAAVNENGRGNTVKSFMNSNKMKRFQKVFATIQKEEFDTVTHFDIDKLRYDLISADTKNREEILKEFDKPVSGRIFILSSCRTIGEGIDTRYANIVTTADPFRSHVDIAQKIGRATRKPEKNMPPSIVVVPIGLDVEEYRKCETDEERDEYIRTEMSHSKSDFSQIFNVLSVYKQTDPELFELCMRYPMRYKPEETAKHFSKYNLKIGKSVGDIAEGISYIIMESSDELGLIYVGGDTDEEILRNVSSEIGRSIHVHTGEIDNPLVIYNETNSKKQPISLFRDENNEYRPILRRSDLRPSTNFITPQKKRQPYKIRSSPDVEVLWNLKNFDLGTCIRGFMDVTVNKLSNSEKWVDKLNELKKFVDKTGKAPNAASKDKFEKMLGYWTSVQKGNYKNKYGTVGTDELCFTTWKTFMNNPNYMSIFSNKQWMVKFSELKKFVDEKNRAPKKEAKSEVEKTLGRWLGTQKYTYKKENGVVVNDEECYRKWKKFMDDPKYSFIFCSLEKQWLDNFDKLKKFADDNNRAPSTIKKSEKMLANWLGTQKGIYGDKNKSTSVVNNSKKCHEKWKNFMNNYLFIFPNGRWVVKFRELKEFVDENGISPKKEAEADIEKTLGIWFGRQKDCYRNKKLGAIVNKDKTCHEAWEEFMSDPKYAFIFSKRKNNASGQKQTVVSTALPNPSESDRDRVPSGRRQNPPPILTKLHQKYMRMSSATLHEKFNEDVGLWHDYHRIRDENESHFRDEDKPYRRIVRNLENFPGSKRNVKVVADLGCGRAKVCQALKENRRFVFRNFDHVSTNDYTERKDISDTGLDGYGVDIAILCLAMWGTNKEDYVKEAFRILDVHGTLFVIEPRRKWINSWTGENRLTEMLKSNGFEVQYCKDDDKFMEIKCIRPEESKSQ